MKVPFSIFVCYNYLESLELHETRVYFTYVNVEGAINRFTLTYNKDCGIKGTCMLAYIVSVY